MRTEKATKARIEMGEETDKQLLGYLKDNPEKTIYNLSKDLGWSTGKIQKSLNRLGSKLIYQERIDRGRLKKMWGLNPKIFK